MAAMPFLLRLACHLAFGYPRHWGQGTWGWALMTKLLRLFLNRGYLEHALKTPSGAVPGARLRRGDVIQTEWGPMLVDCRGLALVLLAADGIQEAFVDRRATYHRALPTVQQIALWRSMGLQVGSHQ